MTLEHPARFDCVSNKCIDSIREHRGGLAGGGPTLKLANGTPSPEFSEFSDFPHIFLKNSEEKGSAKNLILSDVITI